MAQLVAQLELHHAVNGDVLLSHTVVRCGCPVHEETECPPILQIRLFDREPVKSLSSAWEQLEQRATANGGKLVVR